jgi:hypothetical protein
MRQYQQDASTMGVSVETVGEESQLGGHVFVSYAHADEGYVRRLVDHLRSHGVPVWWDENILAGERWSAMLAEKIDTCAAFVVVMTPSAEASRWVAREINEAEHARRWIVPLQLAGKRFFALSDVQYEDVTGGIMPSPDLTGRLRAATEGVSAPPPGVGTAQLRFAVGVVPDPAAAFQHRDVADELFAALTANTVILSGEVDRARILSGLGGVGKTQLAADLARRLRHTGALDALFWVNAANRPAVVAGYAAAAAEIGVGDPADADASADVSPVAVTHRVAVAGCPRRPERPGRPARPLAANIGDRADRDHYPPS